MKQSSLRRLWLEELVQKIRAYRMYYSMIIRMKKTMTQMYLSMGENNAPSVFGKGEIDL